MSGVITPTILDAMENPEIWGRWFRDPDTWRPWLALLCVVFGLPLDEYGLALFRECTGREAPPVGGFLEVWLIVGRRGGKSFILALIAVYLAVFKDWSDVLTPGESAAVKIVAVDRRQARVIFNYARALLMQVPALASLVVREDGDVIELSNGISIEVQTASFRSIRGFTIIALLGDEIAFWAADDTAANPDREILTAARAAQATLRGRGMLLLAGSPYARRGEQFRAFREHHGNDGDPVLVWKAPTRTMNPSVPQEFIDAELERDLEAAQAEFLAEFRTDIESLFDRAVIEGAVVPGRHELPPVTGVHYVAFCDPSGGSADSMTLAIAHSEDDRAVLDALRERRPPFSPDDVVADFAKVLRSYGVSRVTGDRYGGEWPIDRFAAHGIAYAVAA